MPTKLSTEQQSHLARYAGMTGYMRVQTQGNANKGEPPLWFKVLILEATSGYNNVFLMVEPVDGFGAMRVIASRVYISNPSLNLCKETPS